MALMAASATAVMNALPGMNPRVAIPHTCSGLQLAVRGGVHPPQ